jgi:hypothetical protein
MRIDHERGERRQHHGATVCRRLGECGERDAAALAGAVIDDDRLVQHRAEPVGQKPRDEIGRLPRRKADQDFCQFGGLRPRQHDDKREQSNRQTPHVAPPSLIRLCSERFFVSI